MTFESAGRASRLGALGLATIDAMQASPGMRRFVVPADRLRAAARVPRVDARRFCPKPGALSSVVQQLQRGTMLQDVLKLAHESLVDVCDDHISPGVLGQLISSHARVQQTLPSGDGTVRLDWVTKDFTVCGRELERVQLEKSNYYAMVSADARIVYTSKSGHEFVRTIPDVVVLRPYLMAGSAHDARTDRSKENKRIPFGTQLINGHLRALATVIGVPQPYTLRFYPPKATAKERDGFMYTSRSNKDRIKFSYVRNYLPAARGADPSSAVTVSVGDKNTVLAGQALAALLGDDFVKGFKPLVSRAAAGDRYVSKTLKAAVVTPMGDTLADAVDTTSAALAVKAAPNTGGRRKRRGAAAPPPEEQPARTVGQDLAGCVDLATTSVPLIDQLEERMFPVLNDCPRRRERKIAMFEWCMRKMGRAARYNAYDARDHAVNMYPVTPGRSMLDLIAEKLVTISKKLDAFLTKQDTVTQIVNGNVDQLNTSISKICDDVTLSMNAAMWAGVWGPYKHIALSAEPLSPISAFASVHTIQRKGGEMQRPPKGPRGVDQVLFAICPVDCPEGASTGLTLQRMSGAFHAPARCPWSGGSGKYNLPPQVLAVLDAYMVPWQMPAEPAPEDPMDADGPAKGRLGPQQVLRTGVPVLLGCEEMHTEWVGSIPVADAERAFGELDAAVLEYTSTLAADPAVCWQDCLAAAFVSVSLRDDPTTGEAPPLRCLRIDCGAGRMGRPLVVVPPELRCNRTDMAPPVMAQSFADLTAAGSLRELLAKRLVRFVDANSMANAVVGEMRSLWEHPTNVYTHLELHSILRLSLNVASMVLNNRNPTGRVASSSNQNKQKLTQTLTAAPHIPYPMNVLCTGSRKLLHSRVDHLMGLDSLATGATLRVAFACWNGNNQEDGFIVNGGSISHGMLALMAFKAVSQEQAVGLDEPEAGKRDEGSTKTRRPEKLTHLELDGAPPLGFEVPNFMAGGSARRIVAYPENSKYLNYNMHPTYVMHTIAKVDVRHFNLTVCTGQRRPLQTGDKLSNAHGCKGVVRVLSSDQMPTMPDGTKPDIIINPQTLAQRCVYGKLMETFMGDLVMRSVAHIPDRAVRMEIAKLRARLREGSAFEEGHEDTIQELERLTGFRSVAGRSVLIDPVDGSRMTCYAMDVPEAGFGARMAGTGMMGFSVLKQFPSEKLQARGTALDESYNPITNAPTEGRGRCGGGKRGEMEYDAILCHGTLLALFMGDGMSSDGVMQLACPKCGELADDAAPCATCGIRPAYTQISADFRRLIHTLRFIGIDVRLVLEKGESLCELKEVIKRGDYAAVRDLVAESRKDGYWDEEIVETVAEALGRFTADTLPDAEAASEQLSAALGDECMEALKKQIPAELASLL